jgi:dephospho-CoA kinase
MLAAPPTTRLLPVIGITGPIGAGKSAVAAKFVRYGGILVSGDEIGKLVVDRSSRLRRQLARTFGDDILNGERLRRGRLAQRAFASPDAAKRLNAIVHPPLIKELNRQVRQARRRKDRHAVVIDAALLPEWGCEKVPWDVLVGVWAPMKLRQRRLRARGWTDAQIRARARCQMSWTARRALVDYTVKNDADLSLLEQRARCCWDKILSLQGV